MMLVSFSIINAVIGIFYNREFWNYPSRFFLIKVDFSIIDAPGIVIVDYLQTVPSIHKQPYC